jgi:hypothetical protein
VIPKGGFALNNYQKLFSIRRKTAYIAARWTVHEIPITYGWSEQLFNSFSDDCRARSISLKLIRVCRSDHNIVFIQNDIPGLVLEPTSLINKYALQLLNPSEKENRGEDRL